MFKIRVPASSANIGPGFDVLGIGLQLYLEITVTRDASQHGVHLSYEGEGEKNVPLDVTRNLVTQTALYLMRCNGVFNFPTGTKIHVKNPIPLGRGLGSSGAAIVGGVMLGNEFISKKVDKIRMLDYCLMIERHPDNVAAAMLGGFVGSYLNELSDEEVKAKLVPLTSILPTHTTDNAEIISTCPPKNIGEYLKFGWNKQIKCITVIPDFELLTDDAREVLPALYPKEDIIFNLQRLTTLTNALSQEVPNPKLIYNSMKDKLHQTYRSKLIPGLSDVLTSVDPINNPGMVGICLSGAGPTVLCLATENYESIAKNIIQIFNKNGVNCNWKLLDLAYDGATLEVSTVHD